MWSKPGVILAFASWVSVFGLGWIMALGHLEARGFTLSFWVFGVVVAIIASAVVTDRGVVSEGSEIPPIRPLDREIEARGMERGTFPIEGWPIKEINVKDGPETVIEDCIIREGD